MWNIEQREKEYVIGINDDVNFIYLNAREPLIYVFNKRTKQNELINQFRIHHYVFFYRINTISYNPSKFYHILLNLNKKLEREVYASLISLIQRI